MTLTDPNIPFLAAYIVFVVLCLLSMGILIYFKQLAERRKLVEKLKTAGEEDGFYLEDTGNAALSNEQTGPVLNFLNAIGMKFKTRGAKDATATKLKFLRAGFRGANVATVFWGTKVLLAVAFPMAPTAQPELRPPHGCQAVSFRPRLSPLAVAGTVTVEESVTVTGSGAVKESVSGTGKGHRGRCPRPSQSLPPLL